MPNPPPSKKATSGVINRVPCPHCGKPNDFRPLKAQMLLIEEANFDCDYCHKVMQYMGTRKMEVITVIQSPRSDMQGQVKRRVPVREATTVSLAKVRR
jgi:hypothetical protein